MNIVYVVLVLVLLTLVLSWWEADRHRGDCLARHEWKLDALLQKLDIDPNALIEAEIRSLAKAGNKIGAMKRYRDLTGMGLKKAKEFVEDCKAS